jgi:hypothetical protein
MKVGVHEDYQGAEASTIARTVASFPLIAVTREFEAGALPPQDLISRMVTRCQRVWAAGNVAVWSFKPNPADVRSGAWKPYVLALGQFIRDNRLHDRVIIVIWHEPENDVPKYFKNAADFVAVFNQVHDWLVSVDPAIVTSHAALAYTYRNMSVGQAKSWVTRCTIHSVDIYSGQSFPLDMTLASSKAFTTWKASRPTGARWGVSERGWIATDDLSDQRAAAIKAEADYLAALPEADQPDFYVVWNSEGAEKNPRIPLDQAGKDAVNHLFDRLSQVQCPTCLGTGRVQR